MMNPDKFTPLRNPWRIGGYRLFGDWLPFIGFEEIETTTDHLNLGGPVQTVQGTFFTIEWLGRGMSLGGFRVPV